RPRVRASLRSRCRTSRRACARLRSASRRVAGNHNKKSRRQNGCWQRWRSCGVVSSRANVFRQRRTLLAPQRLNESLRNREANLEKAANPLTKEKDLCLGRARAANKREERRSSKRSVRTELSAHYPAGIPYCPTGRCGT